MGLDCNMPSTLIQEQLDRRYERITRVAEAVRGKYSGISGFFRFRLFRRTMDDKDIKYLCNCLYRLGQLSGKHVGIEPLKRIDDLRLEVLDFLAKFENSGVTRGSDNEYNTQLCAVRLPVRQY